MSRLWLNSLLIVTIVMFAQTSMVSSSDSGQNDSSTCGCSNDDKPWKPDCHPVNNIQIGGSYCDSSLGDLSSAADDLLNMTRQILDSLQNDRVPEPITESDHSSATDDLLNMTRQILDSLQNSRVPEPITESDHSSATDDLLNMTRQILDSLQNSRVPEPITENDCNPHSFPRDCSEVQANGVNTSGVYAIYPDGPGDPFFVSCDMDTDGGGWTVFQRRQDGSVEFYLYWSDYKYGFGSVSGEHWLGNDKIHRLTAQKTYELRVDLEDFVGRTRYAQYSSFIVGNETGNYVMTAGDYSGDAGDSLSLHSGHPFSTRDRDNDDHADNCATMYTGAWWYERCHFSNLNGRYLAGSTTEEASGVVWKFWLGHHYSLKKTEMKIRPV